MCNYKAQWTGFLFTGAGFCWAWILIFNNTTPHTHTGTVLHPSKWVSGSAESRHCLLQAYWRVASCVYFISNFALKCFFLTLVVEILVLTLSVPLFWVVQAAAMLPGADICTDACMHVLQPVESNHVALLSGIITNFCQCAEMSLSFHTVKTKMKKMTGNCFLISKEVFANSTHRFLTQIALRWVGSATEDLKRLSLENHREQLQTCPVVCRFLNCPNALNPTNLSLTQIKSWK